MTFDPNGTSDARGEPPRAPLPSRTLPLVSVHASDRLRPAAPLSGPAEFLAFEAVPHVPDVLSALTAPPTAVETAAPVLRLSMFERLWNAGPGSSGTWVIGGASCFCFASGEIGTGIFFATSGVLAFINRARASGHQGAVEDAARGGPEGHGSAFRSTAAILSSPTIDFKAAAVQYVGAAVESCLRKGFSFQILCYGLWAVGELAAARLARKHLPSDDAVSPTPDRTPSLMGRMFQNPALWFVAGGAVQSLLVRGASEVFTLGLANVTAAAGVVAGMVGLGVAAASALRSEPPSGATFRCNAVGQTLFGVASFLRGAPLTGAAFGLWLVACLKQASQMDKDRGRWIKEQAPQASGAA